MAMNFIIDDEDDVIGRIHLGIHFHVPRLHERIHGRGLMMPAAPIPTTIHSLMPRLENDANDDDDDDVVEPMERRQQSDEDVPVVGLAPTLESRIFSIRRNDPNMNHLYIGSTLDPRAWKQLGCWLQNNTHVRYLCLQSCHLKGQSMQDLCIGLQHNESIREFEIGGNLLKKSEMESLVPFIKNNPNLHTLNIEGSLGACALPLLTFALMGRTNSIENISLDDNGMGRSGEKAKNFDAFVTALSKNTNLRRLSLMGNRIGVKECTSLARLLKDPDTKLNSLILRHNLIDAECCAILAEALAGDNTKGEPANNQLHNIDLDRNERVGAQGLMHFLKLICGLPRVPINITVCWECPQTNEKMSTIVTVKVDEPLHTAKSELLANQKFNLTSDMSQVKLKLDFERLDWDETPFFYCMKDGAVVDAVIVIESWGQASPKSNAKGIHNSGICGSIAANHTLSCLGYETPLRRQFPQGILLREFLSANKEENKLHSQRVKILRCHVQYYFCPEDFLEIDAVLQPYVLAWIGLGLKEVINPPSPVVRLNATYCILKGMPNLCGM